MVDRELQGASEFIKGRLYFVTVRGKPRPRSDCHFFTLDSDLVYLPFFADFGPLNLGHVYVFCETLDAKLKDPALKGFRIYYHTSYDGHKRANAAFLMCCYSVLYLKQTPTEAYAPIMHTYPPLLPFRDASCMLSTFPLTVLDCIRGLHRGLQCGFLDFSRFNVEEYEFYERVENGDLNWIVPGMFLAFSAPSATRTMSESGYRTLVPADYIPLFKKYNIGAVIRLNKKTYDRMQFVDAGFHHHELYFLDGSSPPDHILNTFMQTCEQELARGVAVAVHCKAGLGRTGSLIGSYLMKHFKFTAQEVIAWIRICRPGSIIGVQQHFLAMRQARMWSLGEQERARSGAKEPPPRLPGEMGKAPVDVEGARTELSALHFGDGGIARRIEPVPKPTVARRVKVESGYNLRSREEASPSVRRAAVTKRPSGEPVSHPVRVRRPPGGAASAGTAAGASRSASTPVSPQPSKRERDARRVAGGAGGVAPRRSTRTSVARK